MQWLNDWIREIVMIILLAAFLDLIIPNSSLDRYVKVVVGLLILLAILSPIISFLQSDWSVDRLLDTTLSTESTPAMRDVNTVLREGEEMKQYQESQSMRLVQNQMEHMVRELIEGKYPGIIQEIFPSFKEGAEGTPQLDHIQIVLGAARLPEDNPGDSKMTATDEWIQQVKPVEPIRIQIEKKEHDSAKVGDELSDHILKARHHEIRDDVIQMLQANYPWMVGRITVLYDTDTSIRR